MHLVSVSRLLRSFPHVRSSESSMTRVNGHTCVANTSVVDLDSDLVGLGGSNLNILNGERLAGLPGDGGLAGDGLAMASVLFSQKLLIINSGASVIMRGSRKGVGACECNIPCQQ